MTQQVFVAISFFNWRKFCIIYQTSWIDVSIHEVYMRDILFRHDCFGNNALERDSTYIPHPFAHRPGYF